MALILNIHTALEVASICLSNEETVVAYDKNEKQQDHASWMHVAIAKILKENKLSPTQLQAIAVTIGPGSYTGLRVGLSAAKGFCYALNIPLITAGTLPVMAYAVKDEIAELVCPMIDARRMEVYTAVYSKNLEELLPPRAIILDNSSFVEMLSDNKMLFCGNGNKKLKNILQHPHAEFSDTDMSAVHLSKIAYQLYREKKFSDLAYTEPLYIKEFFSTARKLS